METSLSVSSQIKRYNKKSRICLVDVTCSSATGNISPFLIIPSLYQVTISVSVCLSLSLFCSSLPISPFLFLSPFPPSPSYPLFPFSLSLHLKVTPSFGTADDSVTLWQQFESEGQLPGATEGSYMTGATSATVSLGPMETAEITIVLGWFFPDRDFLGLPVGQYTVHVNT